MKKIISLISIDRMLYKKAMCIVSAIIAVIMMGVFLSQVISINQSLYGYNQITNERYLLNEIASRPDSFLADSPFLLFLYLMAGIGALLPALLIYHNYQESKSMYTLKRLPLSPVHLYLAKYLPGLFIVLCTYVWGLLSLLLYYWTYYLVIPKEVFPADCFSTFMNNKIISWLYPFTNPLRFFLILTILLLLPCVGMLAALLERSKRYGVLGLPVLIAAIIVLYYFASLKTMPLGITAVITVLTIGCSYFYIKRIQIV